LERSSWKAPGQTHAWLNAYLGLDSYPILHYPLIRFGNSATRFVVREVRRRDVLINPGQTHAWLNAYLGLDSYPILHRE
jgi:hypothetical protein